MSATAHETLSAFVDGELAPAAAAELAQRIAKDPRLAGQVARLHALRAAVAALAPEPAERRPPARPLRRLPAIAGAIGAALLAGLVAFVLAGRPEDATGSAILLAAHEDWSTGGRPDDGLFAPDLTAAGLRLATVEREDAGDGRSYWRAGYFGPRGCRISLFKLVGDWEDTTIAEPGYLTAQWEVDESRYVAISRRMNAASFAAIAPALEAMTRQSVWPSDGLIMALRTARQPCRPD